MKKKPNRTSDGPKLLKKEFKALMETPIPVDKKMFGILRMWIYLRIICGISAARIKTILVGDLKTGVIKLSKNRKDVLDIRKIMKRMVMPFFDFTDISKTAFDVITPEVLKYQIHGFGKLCGLNRIVTYTEPLAHMVFTRIGPLWEVLSIKMLIEARNNIHYNHNLNHKQ